MPEPRMDINRVLFGSDFETVEEAIAADLLSGIPVLGGIGDFFRVTNADTKRKRALQMLDAISGSIPVIGQLTFTNTLLYLDKTGKIDLSKVDEFLQAAQRLKKR